MVLLKPGLGTLAKMAEPLELNNLAERWMLVSNVEVDQQTTSSAKPRVEASRVAQVPQATVISDYMMKVGQDL